MSESKRIQIGRITIYQRGKKGIWVADFWHEEKHLRRTLETSNVKVARQRAIRLEAQLLAGELEKPLPRTTITAAIDSYVAHLRTEGRRPKTVKKYLSFLQIFDQFAEERHVARLEQVTVPLIDQFRAVRKPTHSPKSMHNEGVMLKGFFKWCVDRDLVRTNPLTKMKFKRPVVQPRGGPSLEQIELVLKLAKGSRHIQFALTAFTGMRSGELQRLRPQDVDLDGNWIQIMSLEGRETKTGQSRKVPIHPRLRALLEAIPKRKRPWFFTAAASKKYPHGDHQISTKKLNEDFLTLLKKAGLPAGHQGGFTVHSLRHSFEIICNHAGIPQRVIDAWMGHNSDRSMASVYYRLTDEESQKFMKKVPFGTGVPAANAGQ